MARYGKNSRKKPEQVIAAAVKFFVGVGMESKDATPGCARFEGAGGFVAISTCPKGRGSEVELETREWDLQVREFLGKI